MPLRILLVEDEPDLAESLVAVLEQQGHVVDHCGDGVSAWTLLRGDLTRYELVLMDWMVPQLSGVELCRRLRAEGFTIPVLLLTARDGTADRVEGLDAGADDYLSKPFAMEELLARVRALQRRHPGYREPQLQVGSYSLDPSRSELTVQAPTGAVRVPLSAKELQLLTYFMEHSGDILSGSRLRNQLWDLHTDPVSNVVAAQVRLLRRKLADHGLPSPITTVPSRGYRFDPAATGGAMQPS